jgi:6-pyruvoyl-tetrahydropterin synthase
VILRVEFQFNAAHRLPFYTTATTTSFLFSPKAPSIPKPGSLDRFHEGQIARSKPVLDAINLNDLNLILENPTAENVPVWMWKQLEPHLVGLKEMHLCETDDAAVIYRGEPVDGQPAEA